MDDRFDWSDYPAGHVGPLEPAPQDAMEVEAPTQPVADGPKDPQEANGSDSESDIELDSEGIVLKLHLLNFEFLNFVRKN